MVVKRTWKVSGCCVDTSVAILWTFPDLAGKLPGCCADATPDATPDAARTATSIAKLSANHRANIGANLGADINRRLVRCFVSGKGGGFYAGARPLVNWRDEKSKSPSFKGEFQRDQQHHSPLSSQWSRSEALCIERGFATGAASLLGLSKAHWGS